MKQKFQNKRVLGMHIRVGTSHTAGSFLLEYPHLHKYFTCAKEWVNRDSNFAIFLATDSPETQDRFKETFKKKLIIVDGPIIHSGQEWQPEVGNNISKGYQKVFTDWWLLGECEAIMGEERSTFAKYGKLRTLVPMYSGRGEPKPLWC